jgi:methionyl-tRNA synthetase
MNKYFITTAIPYINAKPHIGHIQEFLLTKKIVDILQSSGNQVLWQSGTDDNSLKNLESAINQNLTLDVYLSNQISQFKELLKKLNLKPNYLVHTHKKNHHSFVKRFISNLDPKDLYVGKYEGLYCPGCEDFLKKEELVNNLCPDHLKTPQIIQEENVFFKLSSYQNQIYNLINSDTIKITPSSKKQEILSFISRGLEDISISRPVKDDGLGVDFPSFPGHKVYVWIDALINYLSGIDYYSKDGKKTWDQSFKIHVIGKNVWKFHAIYWIG